MSHCHRAESRGNFRFTRLDIVSIYRRLNVLDYPSVTWVDIRQSSCRKWNLREKADSLKLDLSWIFFRILEFFGGRKKWCMENIYNRNIWKFEENYTCMIFFFFWWIERKSEVNWKKIFMCNFFQISLRIWGKLYVF